MDDQTSDLTNEQLAAAAYEAWDRASMCLNGGPLMRRAASPADLHALRAVAALARQGWAPVGTGPSIEDLGPLIAWLGEMAVKAADAGRSDEAGKLTWALQVVGERVDEDAPDHVASVSNMVEPAPDTVYSRALHLAQGAHSQTGGLHGKELEAFRAGIATVEYLLKAADDQLKKRQTTFTAFCSSREFATALRTGGCFNAWVERCSDCDIAIDVYIPLKLLVNPTQCNQ